MYHGIINIYKEPGYTSHDVVARLRGILKQKKIGHTGTLDPAAEGVLPVCLGMGTKLCDLLMDKTKTYETVMLLGQVTDTQDTTGRILAKAQEPDLKLAQEQVETAIAGFLGEYAQIPPMYSALKVKGKKLCDLARAGREVERQARKVQILDISVTKIELPRVWMTVTCSKGTYIRTLCHDIGALLGCGGCMEHLIRTRVESFELKDSLRLDQIEKVRDEGRLTAYILPVEEALSSYPALAAKPEADALLCNGNPLFKNQLDFGKAGGGGEPSEGQMFRIYNSQGQFLGVYQYRQDKSWWKPWKMFLPS
ncbi:MAG: tRNA pseudouridine(55) synthase TruB [Clostridiaceae bacterium]|uniref:tRNA pseudouridine synthase B n=1 Tax=Clostridium porci TaxID=2605778 RepID=A0A7X2NNT9_9CLOT|nr:MULTISPECIES: tRNA pseudouridine(55) synthase TruB [Clostridium]MCI6140008.1 tRNA pseudouridine(55) synthase TruB [Clostridium sp.]MDY3232331.1 tRNA pseudouridine(55) synthase TruB [Clostridiaceae bacterium]MSS38150.1 tRNA pseudouridine(55) synthase TruB [Clostridium porci]